MSDSKNSRLREINSCEVCGSTILVPVLNLGSHPMCDDLVAIDDERVCKEYPIEILFCNKCFTAHQKFQIPKAELFPKTYHYRSRFTADVLNGMADLVQACEKQFGNLSDKKVLDIGCNDGSLLDFFRTAGADTYGIEPTDASLDALAKGHKITSNFLTTDSAELFVKEHGKMDFICFTNVFAHIEDLREVIAALKIVIHPQSIIVIENHYLGSVLNTSQFDTFYHEHPRTYSYQSFIFIAQSLGLSLLNVQFPSRYGGNIRVFMGKEVNGESSINKEVIEKEKDFPDKFVLMNKQIENWRHTKSEFIKNYNSSNGKLIAKAFPGRAAILIKLLNLTDNEIECTFEKPGSMKIGHYLPGTRIPIKSDDELFTVENSKKPILNLAWHIPVEIQNYLASNGHTGEVINILSQEDLK